MLTKLRSHSGMLWLMVVALGLIAGPTTVAQADPPHYSLTIVDLFSQDYSNYALAINNSRQIVGYSASTGGRHAWRWTDGVLEDIGATGGTVIEARDIDDLGRVVGFGNDAALDWVGWTWNGGPMTLIPSLGGSGSRAWSTNESGVVVGDAQIPTEVWNAISWTSGDPANLGTLGGANSQAYAINGGGQISGFAVTPATESRAVIWEGGGITELEHHPGYTDSVAYGLNDNGVAVGTVSHATVGTIDPTLWDSSGLHMLPELGTAETHSYVWAINGADQAVGWSEVGFGDFRATTWIDDQVYDLNDFVETSVAITLRQAWDINEEGVIVGTGMMDTGPRGFMLVPIVPTVAAELSCQPASGTVPFSTIMTVGLTNQFAGQSRRMAAHIDVVLGGGAAYPNWRAGFTNISAGGSYTTSWNQAIPTLGSLIGSNVFTLVAEDVTPAPYNQPPYPASGDTAIHGCTVVANAP